MAEAHAWLQNKYETSYFPPPYYPGGHWYVPFVPVLAEGLSTNYSNPNAYPVDIRGTGYTLGFFSAKRLGAGQFYLMTFTDNAGQSFDGKKNIGSPCQPTLRLNSIGRQRSMIAIHTG